MPKNSFLQAIFRGPKFSLSPIEKTNKGNIQIGAVVPVYKTMLMGRETLQLNLGHLVRFSPTNVPVMEGYEVNFDAFCVPVSALGYPQRKERDIMDFHNLALNEGDVPNPFSHTFEDVQSSADLCFGEDNHMPLSTLFKLGSLGDYLNLPSFKRFRTWVRKWIVNSGLFESPLSNRAVYTNVSNPAVFDFAARAFINTDFEESSVLFDASGRGEGLANYYLNVPFAADEDSLQYMSNSDWVNPGGDPPSLNEFSYYGTMVLDTVAFSSDLRNVGLPGARSFLGYLLNKYDMLADYYGYYPTITPTNFVNALFARIERNSGFTFDYLTKLYELYKIDAQSAFDEYFDFIYSNVLYNNSLRLDGNKSTSLDSLSEFLPNIKELPIDLTYFCAYWKIISDWYINTNIDGDPNEFFINHAGFALDENGDNSKLDLKPFNRRWANDVFTSCVPSSLVTNVAIPVDGTIPDLREANAYQKLKDILRNTGSRLRDVQFGIRGYKPGADSTDMATPLGSLHSFIGIQSVLQTSKTDQDSALASYAGIGTDSSRGDYRRILKVVNNDEATPLVVMVLMSITQRASYMQGMPRYFSSRSSIYDFPIPQLANIGEQEVKYSELYCDYKPLENDSESDYLAKIFGFNRRYYDWFYEENEIHGNMRDSEDFWHGARVFDSAPALNSEFIEINAERDDLNRIFANISPSSMPIYYNVYFEGAKVVALPRYIQYDL